MRLKAAGLSVMAAAAAALVAACGGGGGGAAGVGDTPAIQLSGVAATGLALANSAVDVKCASGTGTATTNESGSYTVTVTDGTMPCLIKVTGTANGVEVTLHSMAEGGTTSGSTTTATANVTPLTEMILARAAGTLPANLFENFGSATATAVTAATLSQAKTDVLAALSTLAGVDLGSIDPFTTALVAATASNPTGGNDYDKALDAIGTKVSAAALPQVVSQIASSAGGSSAPVTLDQVVANVSKGSLAGCPQALSGKYRIVDYVGASDEVEFDFSAMEVIASDGTFNLIASESQACEFTAMGTAQTTIVIGPSGAGATRDAERVGYVFPVQSHALDSITGKWEFLESGINEGNQGEHWIGKMTVAADGKVEVCDYEVMSNNFDACPIDTDEAVSIQASGGSFVLNYGDSVSRVYGFRAPNGSLTLFGSNGSGEDDAGTLRTVFVMSRPAEAPQQALGLVTRYWDVLQRYNGVTLGTPPVSADQLTVTESDSAAGTVTRTRLSDGRVDTWQVNHPITGLRSRSGAEAFYGRAIPGLGMQVGIDAQSSAHIYSISIARP